MRIADRLGINLLLILNNVIASGKTLEEYE